MKLIKQENILKKKIYGYGGEKRKPVQVQVLVQVLFLELDPYENSRTLHIAKYEI